MSGAILDTAGRTFFRLGYEISPIVLVGGAAGDIPGSMLPIVTITEPLNIVSGLIAGNAPDNLDDFFAHYVPLAGATLVDNQIAHYPFANLTTAANAVITQPLRISFKMICPVKTQGGYTAKFLTFMALKAVLSAHNTSGGTYTLVTPTGLYTNCLMTSFHDISAGESKQAQFIWQMDFEQPLITRAQAAAVQQQQNKLMTQITSGLPTDGATSGAGLAGSGANLPAAAVPAVSPSVPTLSI